MTRPPRLRADRVNPRVWTECQKDYLPLGSGKVLDVSEGIRGEDRLTFTCAYCGQTHDSAMALVGTIPEPELDWYCTACGTVNGSADKYCGNCGRRRFE